jgi:hypothetical protein
MDQDRLCRADEPLSIRIHCKLIVAKAENTVRVGAVFATSLKIRTIIRCRAFEGEKRKRKKKTSYEVR